MVDRLGDDWERLRGRNVLVTGGTGFFGHWLLESLARANRDRRLGLRAFVLSRDPERFRTRAPELAADAALSFVRGDVRERDWATAEAFGDLEFPFVIHAATDADAGVNERAPEKMIDTIVAGTRQVLEFARARGAERFLLTSSGAVYGRQPPELPRVPEEFPGGPDPLDPRSAYAEGKRTAELLCAIANGRDAMETVVARCWAFLGPHLPLDRHYAAGNFLRDALAGGPIRINGDGTPLRSYMHPADLAVWLWTILLRGESGRAYNVGSEDAVSIAELAHQIASRVDPAPAIEIAKKAVPGARPERYVPSTERARTELGLAQTIALSEAIERTIAWHRGKA